MSIPRISFSLLLPIVELALWAVLVPTGAGLTYYRLYRAARGSQGVRIHSGQFELTVPRGGWVGFALASVPACRSRTIIVVNLPGLVADVVLSLPTAQPGRWHPSAMSLDTWRSFTFPFYCLPAWWFAGCGLDGLLGRRRLNRVMLWTGSAFCLMYVSALIGYFMSAPADEADLRWLLPGLWLWAILFGVLPLNWLRRRVAA